MTKTAATKQAPPVPRSERQRFASEEVDIVNPTSPLDIRAALNSLDPLAGMEIDIDRVPTPAQLTHEQFMAQDMELQTMDPGSEEENQYIEVNVNGDYRMCRRGESLLCKRYHVAVLANAKELRLKQVKIVNGDGSMGYKEEMTSRMTYPFSVIHDPAGRQGVDWLRKELQQSR